MANIFLVDSIERLTKYEVIVSDLRPRFFRSSPVPLIVDHYTVDPVVKRLVRSTVEIAPDINMSGIFLKQQIVYVHHSIKHVTNIY